MTLNITKLHPIFAGQVNDIELSHDPDSGLVADIVSAVDKYGVLVFHRQQLTEDAQVSFTKAFGTLDLGLGKLAGGSTRLKYVELADISNVGPDGEVVTSSSRKIVSNVANQMWHSDSSFQNPPARYSMLYAVAVPTQGGNTEFSDARAAYDALAPHQADDLAGLRAEHYALHSRFLLGDTDYTPEQRAALPPVQWPIARRHPGSGRNSLFIGAHASHVADMNVAQGRMLLQDLLEHATQRQFVYSHEWQAGDLVIWDNRAMLHRGRPYDLSKRRELRRSTTADD